MTFEKGIEMPTDGNAVADTTLTDALTEAKAQEQPGKVEASETDLTETVAGLSRTITSLKKQLAAKAVEPDDDTKAKITNTEKERDEAKAELAKAKLVIKYGDIAPILDKLMSKPNFDPSLIDDDFVNEIRAAKGTKPSGDTEQEIVQNPAGRGRLAPQDKQDEENLKALKSIFDLS